MAPKRNADGRGPGRQSKKSRTSNLVPLVVDAISDNEALPADLRKVLELGLPVVMNANKSDRHAYEMEIISHAENALASLQTSLEQEHAKALEKQNEITAESEHEKRTKLKEEAEESEKKAQDLATEKKAAQATAKKAAQDMSKEVKDAEKELKHTDHEIKVISDKKSNLIELLSNEYVMLKTGTSKEADGKKAVKKLESTGKQCGLDDTMLQTLAITAKKDPAARSEFELMIFSSLKDAIDKQIETLAQKMAELEPSREEKATVLRKAEEKATVLKEALDTAGEEVTAAQAKVKEAGKEVAKADDFLYQIWQDMKKACDAQDDALDRVAELKDKVKPAFEQLRDQEKEPEPKDEEAEPAVDKVAEEAAVEGDSGSKPGAFGLISSTLNRLTGSVSSE